MPTSVHAPGPGAGDRTPACVAEVVAGAGLRHSSDTEPGLSRRRCGRGMAYRDAQGRAVRDPRVLARIRRLAIPPAWRQVWICADERGHLQATGRDARGRKQYRYHPQWLAVSDQHKFDQLRAFGQRLPALRQRVRRALAEGEEPTRARVLATLVRLLDTTAARIGNSAYARDNGSYGLSTLRRRHLRSDGDALCLGYVGKSGVAHALRVTDPRVAAVVRRCRDLPGQALFTYRGTDGSVHAIDSGDVNDWLSNTAEAGASGDQGLRITAKCFRTWHASVQALAQLLAAAERNIRAREDPLPVGPASVLEAVARHLGNTVAVCRRAYIHPAVLALLPALEKPETAAALLTRRWASRPPARPGLTRCERQLMALLSTAPCTAERGCGGAGGGTRLARKGLPKPPGDAS